MLATDLLDPLIGASAADSALAPAVVAAGLTRDEHVARLTSPTRLAALRATGLLDGVANPVLDRVARLTTRLLGVPVALVSLVGDDAQHFPGVAGLGGWAGAARVTPLSHSFCQHVIATDAPLLVADAARDPLVRDNPARLDLGVVAYAGVPLRTAEGETLGALCAIDGSPVAWTPAQVATLEDLAAAAMAEIELRATVHALVALRDRLEQDAVHDPLTGLLNRRGFAERAGVLLAQATPDAAYTVVLLDLDGFKSVNDTLGHERGDELLREAALAIAAVAHDTEPVARLGGDEFAMLLGGAREHATIRRALDAAFAATPREVGVVLGASFGTAVWTTATPAPIGALLKAADVAMYDDKQRRRGATPPRAGRDRP